MASRREARRVERPRRRRAPALAVALTLVIGGATWTWAGRSDRPEPVVSAPPASAATTPGGTGDVAPVATPEADARVVQDLVLLRAQAVVLAETLDGEDPEVAALAADLRDGSDPELAGLVGWLRSAGYEVPAEAEDPTSTDLDAHADLPGGFSASQLGWLERARVDNADRLFLGLLLAQDEGVVAMLQQHAGHTGDEELRAMAAAMTRTRTERIEQVSAILERLT